MNNIKNTIKQIRKDRSQFQIYKQTIIIQTVFIIEYTSMNENNHYSLSTNKQKNDNDKRDIYE